MTEAAESRNFPETEDIATSGDDYASRFAGPVGEWFLSVQEKVTRAMLPPPDGLRILDVGGGHAQLADPLARSGYDVTVLGSDESCAKRLQPAIETGNCRFDVGNVIQLPYEDASFDVVLSFRLLPHCERWPELVSELCRVARSAVIVDYPTTRSINAIAPLFFKAKQGIEKNTRTWLQFKDRDVLNAFTAHGFRRQRRVGQFFAPMVLHRAMKSRTFSASVEAVCRTLGLSSLLGSPVIVHMVRE